MEVKSLNEPSLEKQLKGHRNGITAICFSPNEERIATSSLDNSILLWDLRGVLRSYRFQGHEEAVTDVNFSPTGKHMASASYDKTVRIWVPTVTGCTGVFKAHSQTVRSVSYSPDGLKILTASDDKIVKLWSSDKHKFLSSFVGHTNWVRSARISNDGSVIASCSDDKTARLWNIEGSECVHTFKDQKGHCMCLAWHPSGCYFGVGTSHGNVKLYDTRTHSLVQYYSIHNEAINKISFHPSGSYLITASKDGKMKILDLKEGHPIFTLSSHSSGVNAVRFSPSGDHFASAGEDKIVCIWKTNFTELQIDRNENTPQNQVTTSHSNSQNSMGRMQGATKWNQCYHSTKYPRGTFVHLDDAPICSASETCRDDCIVNSTFISDALPEVEIHQNDSVPRTSTEMDIGNFSFDVGHTSHIPRTPPKPEFCQIPKIKTKSVGTTCCDNNLYGMIALKENDVCYTSGKIEWVGKKRSFPLNTGFKILNDVQNVNNEPMIKRIKKLNETYTCDKMRECDCVNVLPTVNAIVDHLNALHEAVDLIDLRLNTLEGAASHR